MIVDNIQVTGDLTLELFRDGVSVHKTEIHNMVVDSGRNLIAKLLAGTSTRPTHIGLGSINTAPVASNTELFAEIGSRRVFNSAYTTDNVTTYVTTFPSGVGTAAVVREAGLFNASTGGIMLCRTSFNTITKTTADNLVVTWNVRVN
jgi:hypothetical protein